MVGQSRGLRVRHAGPGRALPGAHAGRRRLPRQRPQRPLAGRTGPLRPLPRTRQKSGGGEVADKEAGRCSKHCKSKAQAIPGQYRAGQCGARPTSSGWYVFPGPCFCCSLRSECKRVGRGPRQRARPESGQRPKTPKRKPLATGSGPHPRRLHGEKESPSGMERPRRQTPPGQVPALPARGRDGAVGRSLPAALVRGPRR